jgi:ribosomal-protein-alanine N-acetyltransferase
MQHHASQLPIPQVLVETDRMLLKGITPEIMNLLFTSYSDADIISFLCIADNAELEWERDRYNKGLSWYRATSIFFIMTDKQTSRRLGRIGYHTWAVEHSRAEIGYHIYNDEDKNKGYMSEAMQATLAYGFNEMALNRVEALISLHNTPSLKLVNRFGFTKEGVLRSHYCKNGILEDSACFSLLKQEFETRH